MNAIVRYRGLAAAAACILLAACGGGVGPSGSPPGVVSPSLIGRNAGVVRPDRGRSWMSPQAKQLKELLYVGDWSTEDVYVYDYKSGKAEGALTGFTEPYGMCVDAKGDIYISNFGGADAVEYAHGGTSPLKTYTSGGEPIGCSVDSNGNVAVTSFSPGEAIVYSGGDPNKGTTYASCAQYQWTMGYDDKHNLIGSGYGGVYCALLKGASTMTTLSVSGIQIDFPGGTMWDGRYIALGDQSLNGKEQTGIVEATLSGTTLMAEGTVTLSDTCYSNYVDVINPFIVGKKNTPVNRKQGNAPVGPNLWCYDAGTPAVDYWKYPAGGDPYKALANPPKEPYSAGVSIAK